MKRRVSVLAAALVLALGSAGQVAAAPDCDGEGCATASPVRPAKPLDVMKFMREQAASTRAGETKNQTTKSLASKAQPSAHAHRSVRRTAAIKAQPPVAPPDAALSVASQNMPQVQEVAGDEFNAIDAAAPAASAFAQGTPSETVGAGITSEGNVKTVAAEELNEIDRMSTDVRTEQTKRVHMSWLQWIWSALGGTFTALASAMHHLIG